MYKQCKQQICHTLCCFQFHVHDWLRLFPPTLASTHDFSHFAHPLQPQNCLISFYYPSSHCFLDKWLLKKFINGVLRSLPHGYSNCLCSGTNTMFCHSMLPDFKITSIFWNFSSHTNYHYMHCPYSPLQNPSNLPLAIEYLPTSHDMMK